MRLPLIIIAVTGAFVVLPAVVFSVGESSQPPSPSAAQNSQAAQLHAFVAKYLKNHPGATCTVMTNWASCENAPGTGASAGTEYVVGTTDYLP